MAGVRKMPKCMGHYDVGDTICDGDPKGETDEDRMACVFRDRCAALGQACKSMGKSPSDLVRTKRVKDPDNEYRKYAFARQGDEEFGAFLNSMITTWGVRSGRVTVKNPTTVVRKTYKPAPKPARQARPTPAPSAETRRKATTALKQKATQAQERAYQMISWFVAKLATNTGRVVLDSETKADPGDMYLVDRMGNSKYVAVYCALPGNRKVGIALVYPQMRTGKLNIHVAAKPKDFSEPHAKRLEPQDEPGRFCAKIKGLDAEGATIVSEAISHLIEHGAIDLGAAA